MAHVSHSISVSSPLGLPLSLKRSLTVTSLFVTALCFLDCLHPGTPCVTPAQFSCPWPVGMDVAEEQGDSSVETSCRPACPNSPPNERWCLHVVGISGCNSPALLSVLVAESAGTSNER